VGLSDLEYYGEPGTIVYRVDCVELMSLMPAESVDVIFADPPYRLSGGGVSVKSGRLAPVDKGEWDRSKGFRADHEFNVRWLKAAQRVLKPDGTLWVSGTHHIIFSIGFALQSLGFRIINDICSKYKPKGAGVQGSGVRGGGTAGRTSARSRLGRGVRTNWS
jgi:site-specific DNA-methyltransferase (adenine-specific)